MTKAIRFLVITAMLSISVAMLSSCDEERTLVSIEVTKQPTKTVYTVGEPFDLAGLEVTATFSDGSTETITVTAGMVTFNNAQAGTNLSATITFTYNGMSRTASVPGLTVRPAVVAVTEELLTGPISANRTLGVPHGRKSYLYDGDVYLSVNNGAVLTILPGTTIRFSRAGGGIQFTNGASLRAEGLPTLLDAGGNPIVVNDVELDGRIRLIGGATKGSWQGLRFETNSENRLKYVNIINAGSQTHAQGSVIEMFQGTQRISIDNCLLDGGLKWGVNVGHLTDLVSFTNNVIRNMNDAPVLVRAVAQLAAFDETSVLTGNAAGFNHILVPEAAPLTKNITVNAATVPYRLVLPLLKIMWLGRGQLMRSNGNRRQKNETTQR